MQSGKITPLFKVLLRIQVYNNPRQEGSLTDEIEAGMPAVLFSIRTARAYRHIIIPLSNKNKKLNSQFLKMLCTQNFIIKRQL